MSHQLDNRAGSRSTDLMSAQRDLSFGLDASRDSLGTDSGVVSPTASQPENAVTGCLTD